MLWIWLFCALAAVPGASGASGLSLIDDLEGLGAWEALAWGERTDLALGADHVSSGKHSLAVSFRSRSRFKKKEGLFVRRGLTGTAGQLGELTFDVFVDGDQPIELSLTVDADVGYESPRRALAPGWNKDLRFSLAARDWKTVLTDWQHTSGIDPDMSLGSLVLTFFPGQAESGRYFLDNLRARRALPPVPALRVAAQARTVGVPPSLGLVRASRDEVPIYEPVEWEVRFSGTVADPFDRKELDLRLELVSPGHKAVVVHGFLESGQLLGAGVERPVWKIRFTPFEAGEWKYAVVVENPAGQARSGERTLRCLPGAGRGFVRVDEQSKIHFRFDDGSFYYPLGANVGWASDREYEKYFARMQQASENWARVWLTSWNLGIEWKQMGHYGGLGRYNLHNARRLDRLLELAKERGIYLELVFDYHGSYSASTNSEWRNNCYNAANGGVLERPEDFFVDERARRFYKQRLDYISARWGFSPQVMAWELFNEVTYTDRWNRDRDFAWHQEMAGYLRGIDPYRHLISTSYGNQVNDRVYALSVIDFTQAHVYENGAPGKLAGLAEQMLAKFHKPTIVAEIGSDAGDGVDAADSRGVFLHAVLWAQTMSVGPAGAMSWWWDTQIDPNDLYPHYRAVSGYLAGIDLRKHAFHKARGHVEGRAIKGTVALDLLGKRADDLCLVWVYDRSGLRPSARLPTQIQTARLTLTDLSPGPYIVKVWDTQKPVPVQTFAATVPPNGMLALSLPAFTNDLALSLTRTP